MHTNTQNQTQIFNYFSRIATLIFPSFISNQIERNWPISKFYLEHSRIGFIPGGSSGAASGSIGHVIVNNAGLGLQRRLGTEPGTGLWDLKRNTHDEILLNFLRIWIWGRCGGEFGSWERSWKIILLILLTKKKGGERRREAKTLKKNCVFFS